MHENAQLRRPTRPMNAKKAEHLVNSLFSPNIARSLRTRDRPQRKYRATVNLVQNLRDGRIKSGEAAQNAHVSANDLVRRDVGQVAYGQKPEQGDQGAEDDLQGPAQAEGSDEHAESEKPPDGQIKAHGGFIGLFGQPQGGRVQMATSESQKEP